jgi:hypothetical protein
MNDTATEGIEATICDACHLIPLTQHGLDIAEPVVGWLEFFRERGVEIIDDDLGRPAVVRGVLGELIAEHREREARKAEELAREVAADRHVPSVDACSRGGRVVRGLAP